MSSTKEVLVWYTLPIIPTLNVPVVVHAPFQPKRSLQTKSNVRHAEMVFNAVTFAYSRPIFSFDEFIHELFFVLHGLNVLVATSALVSILP